MIESLVKSLFYTLIIELTVAICLGIRSKEDIKVVICANVCTNPVIVYITNCVLILRNWILYFSVVLVLEVVVLFVEGFIYKKCLRFNTIPPFMISLICNVTSFGIGLIVSFMR